MRSGQKRARNVVFPERYVPADGSRLEDPKLGYLIAGFTAKGDVARPGERFYNAMWSRDRGGRCAAGQHQNCAHGVGGQHEAGVTVEGADGDPHVWRCGCDCHAGPDPQRYAPRGDKWLVAAHKSRRQPAPSPAAAVQLELFEVA